jgi:hypothetical protein
MPSWSIPPKPWHPNAISITTYDLIIVA